MYIEFTTVFLLLFVIVTFSPRVGAVDTQEYKMVNNSKDAIQIIESCRTRKLNAQQLANTARVLECAENHPIIQFAKDKWHSSHDEEIYYTKLYNELKLREKEQAKRNEYPVAYSIWEYLDNLGYNDYVKSGIIGNLMAEVGGQTLNLKPMVYSGGYYGICMWSLYYCPNVNGKDLQGQLDYLKMTIKQEFDNYGFCYQNGFNYEKFLNLQNSRQAALAFAECYERCHPASNYVRQNNADIAYDYFVE